MKTPSTAAPAGRAESRGRRTSPANADHVYRVIEIVGTSKQSISDAIDNAINRAHKTLRNLRWFEVVRTSGNIADGKIEHYQVTLSIGFTMEEPA
jgi:flavin-binding protein dodecin